MKTPTVTQVADNTYLASGTAVNWTLITDGDAVTLIDAGFPADLPAVEESLRMIGHRIEQVAAILITHCHVDHIGSIPGLLRRADIPVHVAPPEVGFAHGDYREQAGPLDVIPNLWRPGFLTWTIRIALAGAMKHVRVPTATPFPRDGALDLPGKPVPVPTPGHTSGHCCYYLPDVGVLATGDTLVTGHPTSQTSGPQLLMPMFSHDHPATVAALDTLEPLAADTLLPGHGIPHRGDIRTAVSQARERLATH
ncbi:MBL fold metallo-hydrolase [Actinokineospora iranica]|uniref:Glyoxylase, beta-lactamase superfamily II n=1 Tax=Actinokineospora iranica TaxID=1271860 RepID=A0A1G6TQG0_9PSEU|nr:MBL fold metallo-hydrolase [Actinokineospora iranica]SDD31412.1 Glyoxylase, beta-lactamase superfamily II [Actinokineospora iranica]